MSVKQLIACSLCGLPCIEEWISPLREDGTRICGDCVSRETRSILDYLRFARDFAERFPGFDADVHGLQHEAGADGCVYTVDCIREE